jgi:outer membrane protein TolC
MKYLVVVFCIWGPAFPAWAQAPAGLSLEEAYAAARRHYPLASQSGLIAESEGFTLANAAKGYLPQLSVSGQASYQSAVTRIPIQVPGMDIPVLSKDQYKLYGELSQVVYDGGTIRHQQKTAQANALVETQQLEVELYQLRARIQQLFFGILAIDAQLKQSSILVADIRSGIALTEGAIANGTALKSSLQVLQAELLQASQGIAGLRATRKAYTGMLGLFLQQPLNENNAASTSAGKASAPGSGPSCTCFSKAASAVPHSTF